MKIGSKIRPRNGKARRVEVHGHLYVFAATPDKAGNTHFVADVPNEQHAETFLGSGDFYAFSKDHEQQATLTRDGAAPASDAEQTSAQLAASAMSAFNAGATGGQVGDTANANDGNPALPLGGHDPEAVAAATELLKGSINEVGKAVANQSLPVIRAALALEKASPTQRKGMVTLLEATLEGAKQAGVEG